MSDTPDELEELLQGLTSRVDPVPPSVTEAADAAWTWRTIDEELAGLAELQFDSFAETELAGSGQRGTATASRELSFESDDVVVELEVLTDAGSGAGLSVLGQIAPAVVAEVRLQGPGADRSVPADELGRFRFDGVAPGPTRLVLATAAGTIATTWVFLG